VPLRRSRARWPRAGAASGLEAVRRGLALFLLLGLCLALPAGQATADGDLLGLARGRVDVLTRPTPELMQALLTFAGIPVARDGATVEGSLKLGAKSVPVTGSIVAAGIDGLAYFDLAISIKQLAPGERVAALDLAFKLSLDASGQKLVVTEDDRLELHRSFLLGGGFDRDVFIEAFGKRLLRLAETAARQFIEGAPTASFERVEGAMSMLDAERILANAPHESRPVYKSQQAVLQAMLANADEGAKSSGNAGDEDCDWCLVPGVMTHYALVFRDRQAQARRMIEIGNAVAPTFNRNRDEILELINRFNGSARTPARAFIANSGDIYLEYAYSVQAGIEPTYVAAVGAKVMPAAAKALMDMLKSKSLEDALLLEHVPPLEADPSASPARFVGRLVLKYASGESGLCTGMLVGPSLVLTAAHCVRPPGGDGSYSRVIRGIFQLGYNRKDWTQEALIEETATAEGYSDDPEFLGDRRHDWALVRLSDDLSGYAGDVPIKTLDDAALTAIEGARFFALGYGSYDKDDPGEIMLQSPYALLSWSLPFAYAGMDPDPGDGNGRIMVFTGKAVPGDSGGPVILDDGGKLYLVGIAIAGYSDLYETESRGFSPDWRYSPRGDIAFVVPAAEFVDKLEAMRKGEPTGTLVTAVSRSSYDGSPAPEKRPTPR
jgi:hypothetical protein